MKYFVTNINKLEIAIILVDESISRLKTFQKDELVKIYSNTLNISEKFIVLACIKNEKIEYIYGKEMIIQMLYDNEISNINWKIC